MTKPLTAMPNPGSIGAGQTAQIDLPLGMTYDLMLIEAMVDVAGTSTPVPASDWGTYFGEINLIADGTTIQEIDAADLVKINGYHFKTFAAGILPVFQSRPWMALNENQDVTSIGTGGLSTLVLQIEIKPGVTVNSLKCFAERSVNKPFAVHRRIEKFFINQGIAGDRHISQIPKGNYALQAVHFNTTEISEMNVEVDNRKIMTTNKRLRAAKNNIDGKTAQTGMTHLHFLTGNRFAEGLPLNVSDFRIIPTFTQAGNYVFYTETIRDTL